MKFCEECGTPLVEGVAFCENCGTPVKHSTTEPIEELIETASETSVDNEAVTSKIISQKVEGETYRDRPQSTPNPKKSGWKWSLLALLLVGVIGGCLWWRGHASEEKTATVYSSIEHSTETTQERSTSQSLVSDTETTVESEESAFNVTEARTIAQTALNGAAGNFGVVLAPIEAGGPTFSMEEKNMRRAASVIKLFIMAAVYEQVDQKKLALNQEYTLLGEDIVGGTGVLQEYPIGSTLTINQLLAHMMVDSDNTAGNILIEQLGGLSELNNYLREQNFSKTVMNRLFLDTEALEAGIDNYTSAEDVAHLLQNVYQQKLVSPVHDLAMLELLNQNKNHSKLPAQIGPEVEVYNKAGEYADYGVENDACIFEKGGTAYILVVLSEDGKSSEQILAMNRLGKEFYEMFMESERR
ncbi:serine hydrolase [Candidatus Enterococcus ferrettii]|uniref:Serine hydrolase n=1 Tax=Candidatus Enterococcus ferrettii TaxID=2815324 RepID=A0ABV0EQV6_9ENTE|nr:serine hydrolase [Enterococcus sp. 665A]MBO1342706.1 serine hydrolase [Enterococcus sp. 665A]